MLKNLYYIPIFVILLIIMPLQFVQATLETTKTILEKARQEFYAGNLEVSAGYYNLMMQDYPEDPASYLEIAAIYRQMNNLEKGLDYLQKGLEATDDQAIKREITRFAVLMGEEVAGRVEAVHGDRDLLFYLGLARMQAKAWSEAAEYFHKAVEIDDRFAVAIYFLGLCQIEKGDLKEATENLEKALRLERSFTGINALLGDLYYQLGEKREALSAYLNTPAGLIDEAMKEKIAVLRELFPPPAAPPVVPVREVKFHRVAPVDDDAIPLLRVALMTTAREINFQAGSAFIILRDDAPVFRGEACTTYILINTPRGLELQNRERKPLVRIKDNFRLELEDQTSTLYIFDVEYGQGYFWAGREDQQYRGSFIIQRRDNEYFLVINEVNTEEYLYSVIPSEMPASWPMEALKAQAVAARSYTINRLDRNPEADYHLVASVFNAAYNGVGWEHGRSTQAVDETRGLVLTYQGQVIDAVYSSNSGGHTEASLHVWGGNVPYLQAVQVGGNEKSFPLSPYNMENWIRSWEPSYSLPAGFGSLDAYRWTRVILPEEPPLASHVGRITDIIPQARGTGGSIISVRVVGEDGETVISGDNIRRQLGGLKSNRFIVEPVYFGSDTPRYFILWGGGWGHSVGMDQTGAAGMASAGYTYQQILAHFYRGIDIIEYY